LTASHDSEWFELKAPARHVPASGTREPGGTGYPPPVVGELATTFVNGTLEIQAPLGAFEVGVAPSMRGVAPSAKSIAIRRFIGSPFVPFAG
jgi:hypothetical protein